MPLSILTRGMNSETKKRRGFLRDTLDTLSWREQMEVPSSFDESLVRNGRLHRAHHVVDIGARAREIYETTGIVRHVTGMKKTRNYSRLCLFRVAMTGASTAR